MATVSSHILDAVSGDAAGGIRCQLFIVIDQNTKRLLFDVSADREGRILQTVALDDSPPDSEFELVFHSSEYFNAQSMAVDSIVKTPLIRFLMPDDQRRYHMPIILSPRAYSTWWSA